MREYYNKACDIVDEVRNIAADSNVSLDQAMQAVMIAAIAELRIEVAALADTIESK